MGLQRPRRAFGGVIALASTPSLARRGPIVRALPGNCRLAIRRGACLSVEAGLVEVAERVPVPSSGGGIVGLVVRHGEPMPGGIELDCMADAGRAERAVQHAGLLGREALVVLR